MDGATFRRYIQLIILNRLSLKLSLSLSLEQKKNKTKQQCEQKTNNNQLFFGFLWCKFVYYVFFFHFSSSAVKLSTKWTIWLQSDVFFFRVFI